MYSVALYKACLISHNFTFPVDEENDKCPHYKTTIYFYNLMHH